MTIAEAREPSPRFIDIDGARMAVRRSGSSAGAPVICLHATGHGARDFDDFAARVGDAFDVIALDWPGHGRSPHASAPASAASFAALIEGAAAAFGLDRYILLGNSIGGAAAIIHAAAHPGRVRGLVLCNPGGLQPVSLIARLYCRHLMRRFEKGERGDAAFARWFARYYRDILRTPEARWRREEIVADGYASARALREAWGSFAEPGADIRTLPARLQCPVLYAWAKNDQAVSWARSARAARRAPQHEVSLFEGGHAAFLEQPEAFAQAFRAFAQRLPA